jgi:hypothetical protein
MKEFILAILASLVAAIILLAVPGISEILSDSKVYLNVDLNQEQYDSLFISTINAYNNSNYAINSITFIPKTSGTISHIGIKSPEIKKYYNSPDINSSINIGSLAKNESFQIIIVIINSGLERDLEKIFNGSYAFLNNRGRVVSKSFIVRAKSDAVLEQYLLLAKWAVIIIIIVGASLTVYIISRKIKKKFNKQTK